MKYEITNRHINDIIFLIIMVMFIFFTGFVIGRYRFPKPKIITENEASQKCKEAKGIFDVGYDFIQGHDTEVKLIFRCYKKQETIFKM